MNEDDLPPRVRAAEERRHMRELLERSSLGTPAAVAVRNIGAWELRAPGAPRPTAEDYRLAAEEMDRLEGELEQGADG